MRSAPHIMPCDRAKADFYRLLLPACRAVIAAVASYRSGDGGKALRAVAAANMSLMQVKVENHEV